jgi:hypothetical protein
MQAMLPLSAAKLNKPVTPLKKSSFQTLLARHSLAEKYPTLVQFIADGFPIGPMPPVMSTLIQKNHTAEPAKVAIIREDFVSEVSLGRMIGPLTMREAQALLRGHFRTSPLGLVPKSGSPGRFRVIHDLSYRGSAAQSVNDCIPSDRPTRWVDFEQFAAQVCTASSRCFTQQPHAVIRDDATPFLRSAAIRDDATPFLCSAASWEVAFATPTLV